MAKELPEYTVVFLGNSYPPKQLVLLKRSEAKAFAPGLYTGIGGHREPGDRTIIDTCYRELKEETALTGISLTLFAKVIVSGDWPRILHYAFGYYLTDSLPKCTEGTLEWVSTNQLSKKKIVPTTLLLLQEWAKREFTTEKPFTLSLTDNDDIVRLKEVAEGLNN